MKISSKTWITLGVAFFVFGALWIGQVLYFDSLTKKLSIQGVGPVFVGHLSENLASVVTRPLVVAAGTQTVAIEPGQLATWIEPYHRVFTGRLEYRLNQAKIAEDLQDFAAGLALPAVNAQFGMENGTILETISAKSGQELDLEASRQSIAQALIRNQSRAELVVTAVEPELSLAKLQTIGITALLGEGSSNFTGSPGHRVHNIGIGAKRMDDIIMPAGTTFSFVDHLGEVEASTGYLPELVIKSGKIIPEYGGGLCQVSTTMFRAAMYAGLKIDERRPHSIPVRYYNPQGFDATIYPGVVDLKFTNDTAGPILIQSRIQGSTITFAIFGALDGRVTKIEGPYQYESNPDGSLKTVLYRTIAFAGSTPTKESYYSSYKSPALFQVIKNPLE